MFLVYRQDLIRTHERIEAAKSQRNLWLEYLTMQVLNTASKSLLKSFPLFLLCLEQTKKSLTLQ